MPFDLDFSLMYCSISVTVMCLHPWNGTWLVSDAVLDPELGGGGGALCFFSFSGFFSYSYRWISCKLKEAVQRKTIGWERGWLSFENIQLLPFQM